MHKREQELYGLVTPVFLPLLDARDSSPDKRRTPKPPTPYGANDAADSPPARPSRDAEQTKARKQRKDNKDLESPAPGALAKDKQSGEAPKKMKRSTMKKSALRHKDKPRTPRKRVSLVIDGQTVHPSDTVDEPLLTSPSSETTSASNSIASLDDMIDPRLTTSDPPLFLEHRNDIHHSLPLPMANAIQSASKAYSESHTPTPVSIATDHSPPLHSPRSPSIPSKPTQPPMRTFLDPSPIQQSHSIPETAGPDPIYSISPVTTTELESDSLAEEEQDFDTYVGGLHGSGVADVDQAGSYGYPSSLGASYMESYMQNRPLRVRMEAATKAGLSEAEKRRLLEERVEEEEDHVHDDVDNDEDDSDDLSDIDMDHTRKKSKDLGEDHFMGDMDDF